MSTKNKIIVLAVIVAILLMGIGYAAISNVTLNITGNVTAEGNADNFKVYFTQANTTRSDNTNVTVGGTAGTQDATVDIAGMTTKNQTEYAILEIKNEDTNIGVSASINVTATATDTEYFDVEAVMCDSTGNIEYTADQTVAPDGVTYVKVSAKLLKTPLTAKTTTINVQLTATPVE